MSNCSPSNIAKNGFTPIIAMETIGTSTYLKVIDWYGGIGNRPETGYIGINGIVSSYENAIPINDLSAKISIVGVVPTAASLPTDLTEDNVGEAYITQDNSHLWVFNKQLQFIDVGTYRGDQGNDGPLTDLQAGTISEGPFSISITGTAPNKILNLTIPRGEKGDDGSTIIPDVTEFRFAKNGSPTTPPTLDSSQANPTGWTLEQPVPNALEYVWQTHAIKNNGALQGQWSTPIRINGVNGEAGANPEIQYSVDGVTDWHEEPTSNDVYMRIRVGNGPWRGPIKIKAVDGQDGQKGPFILYRGEYNPTVQYTGTNSRVEAVFYSVTNKYYVTRVDAGFITGVAPNDVNKWNEFEGQFESVATNLLLAQFAYIENLGVRYLKTSDTGKRVEINGDTNRIQFYISNGDLILEVNDDNTFEGRTPSSIIYGPGISIGTDPDDNVNGYSSLGRKVIYSNGRLEIEQQGVFGNYVKAKGFTGTSITAQGQLDLNVDLVLATGNVILNTYPDNGEKCTIKNITNGIIEIEAASTQGGRYIKTLDNSEIYTLNLPAGAVAEFQYYTEGFTNWWIQIK